MEKKFKEKGEWWLPENPDKKVKGEIEYDEKESIMKLILEDSFLQNNDGQIIISGKPREIPIILGQTEWEGGLFTLLSNSFMDDFPKFIDLPGYIFKGEHFAREEEIKFKKIIGDFSHIGRCIGKTGFSCLKYSSKTVTIKYEKPDLLEIPVDDVGKIIIEKKPEYFKSSATIPKRGIEEKTIITIEFPEEKNLEECYKFLYTLQSFFSFWTGILISPLEVKGIIEKEKNEKEIEIFYRKPKFNSLPSFIIPLSCQKLKVFLKNWFIEKEKLEDVYALYNNALDTSNPFRRRDFVSLVSAFEAYHRNEHGGKYLCDKQYEDLIERVLENIPEELKFLESKFKYGNEFILRKRLKDIFKKHKRILEYFILDRDKFIHSVVDTRNSLVHIEEKNREKIPTGKDLYWLFFAMRILLEVCFLKELGEYKDEEVKEILQRKYDYQISEIKENLFPE